MDSIEGDSSDPLSLHRYLYANSDPVGMSDPSGCDATLLGLSMAQWASATIGAIAIVSVYEYSKSIQSGGEGLESPLGGALAGLTIGAATRLLNSVSESVRSQLKKADIAIAAATMLAIKERPKIVPVSFSVTPTIALNVFAYQGGKPQLLTRVGFAQRNLNRANALRGRGSAGPGLSWDEYPFASTAEGGTGASVMRVPQMENWRQGGIIGACYIIENINVGDKFWAVVIP